MKIFLHPINLFVALVLIFLTKDFFMPKYAHAKD